MPNLAAVLRDAEQRLAHSSPSARLDAEVLLAHVLQKPRSYLAAWPAKTPPRDALAYFGELLERRAAGQPVAHLTGEREFWSLSLQVSEATLIPRPETELLVERAATAIRRNAASRVLDLGTGSGAIALALALKFPRLKITASDASTEALRVAERNRKMLGASNVSVVHSDWFQALNDDYEIIVANPPYVPGDDPHLREGDVRFEPRLALDGGDDGLECLRYIIRLAPRRLLHGGWLLLEHGFDQGAAVRELLSAAGFSAVGTHRDLAGHERVSEGRRQ
ncbi:MAG: peptide chain release factor N(5)-glutamine methyltransferase [Gammaproteobacteria bacterium]|nr:peptide chain release factor N(5)-glutamine methyltransferase [Gammaproteobacteria bacterium]